MAILFVAAEGDELKPFTNTLSATRKLKWPIDYAFEGILEGRRVLLAANGAGPKLAAQAVELAIRAVTAAELSSSRLEAVVSVGFCGALTAAHREGDIVCATEILDQATGQKYACSLPQYEGKATHGLLLSQDRIALGLEEKGRLAETGAVAVDMESTGVAVRTARAGLPLYCIKVVSDRADESFGFDLNSMRTPDGRVARGKIVSYSCTHPWLLPELLRWKRRAANAAQALGAFLVHCRIDVGGRDTSQSNPGGEILASE
jgi:nucleoside phosphorylase